MRAAKIKEYITTLFAPEDAHLLSIKKVSLKEGLPPIEVGPNLGKFLSLLAKIQRPKKVLEIGTLGGYSTLWLARALEPDARLISLELSPHHAALARKNIALAGFDRQVEIREGSADWLLDQLIRVQEGPFDLIFIDADKENYSLYLEKALKLARPGTLILIDNLIPKGDAIGKPENGEAEAIYRFNQELASHSHLETILVTTITGNQGRIDAVGVSLVLSK